MRCSILDSAILDAAHGGLPDPASSADAAPVLQRVLLDRPCSVRELYWRTEASGGLPPQIGPSGGLRIPAGVRVSFDGYFNSLYEYQWRAHTRLARLALRVRLEGAALLRVWRATEADGAALVWEGVLTTGATTVDLPAPGANLRTSGRLSFELTALEDAAILREAAYVAPGATPDPVGLTLVFCTYNRERDLGLCLERIAGDPALVAALGALVVVNQGRPDLRRHAAVAPAAACLGDTLRVIEQGNFGGAGGFTRGLIAALDDARATHACFIDDDVRVEPESLARMVAFFGFARPNLALGGHMLDAIRPYMLYEAGAVVHRAKWQLHPLHAGRDLREAATLDGLTDPRPMDYNGWWLFGFPLAMAREIGLPLPCFIRGDDVEWGLRLAAAGYATVGLPGVAVWHEPFYLKIGNWQLYYEVRNQLVAAALHLGLRRRHAATVMLKHLLVHLLTFRYFSAAMILRGIADFLRGPAVLDENPGGLHAGLLALKAEYPETTVPRTRPLAPSPVAPSPRSRAGFVLAMARILLRNLLRPTRRGRPERVDVGDLVWFRQAHAEHVAVDAYWDAELPTYARSREHFRALGAEAARVLWRLWREGEAVAGAWRAATPRLTSTESWRRYLDMRGG